MLWLVIGVGLTAIVFSGASRFDIVVTDNIRLGVGAAIGVYWAYTRGWKSNRFSTQLVEDDEYFEDGEVERDGVTELEDSSYIE